MENFFAPAVGSGGDDPDPSAGCLGYPATHYSGCEGQSRHGSMLYVAKARQLLIARKRIAEIMPRNLLRDSAWDVMLELYIGTAQDIDVYVKQAIIASGECPATAMRIIARLEKAGFLIRAGDQSDLRRVVVSLSPDGMAAMEILLDNMVSSEAAPAAPHYSHAIFALA
jgi:DNA-binding MarR family transcriptional regulator